MTEWLADTFIATTILMALVMAVRGPVTQLCGARVAYALWLIPAARFFMPTIERTIEASGGPLSADPSILLQPEVLVALASNQQTGGTDWTVALVTVWLTGASLLFLWRVTDHFRECEEILEESDELGRANGIRIVQARGITGPIAFGVVRKHIALPPNFYRDYSARERDLALAHEFAHHRSGDLLINLIAFFALCLHWFNPIAWIAWRAFRFDQEAACDARVLSQTISDDRPAYGRAVAKASSGQALLFSSVLDNPQSLKKRLKTMAMNDKSRLRVAVGRIAIGAGLLVALPMTATVSYAIAQAPGDEQVTQHDGERHQEHTRLAAHQAHDETTHRRVYTYRSDGEAPTREEIEAMIPSEEEIAAMIPSEAEIRAMIPSEAELREMIPDEAELREMIPDREELLAMIPDVETLEQCHANGEAVHTDESVDPATGRERIRIMICRERLGQQGRAEALEGMREARSEVAADAEIPEDIRTMVLARLDAGIARLGE
ncbi:hypothetical protein HFP51_06940 [Parasphingopyxis sp. CP4]|uniref:M56 family metallopeptidase n=1 Tax=Parasphingopyxis sp. CP4 TaxID=2724527 RepID=UPI0015A28F9D|nr:M56 family metallopeptidase [Parasphingopyxis sp. CP4]QLC21940.1 hypothetical protein HFP51_06940 [Parasphingopyxis sp. CP4]